MTRRQFLMAGVGVAAGVAGTLAAQALLPEGAPQPAPAPVDVTSLPMQMEEFQPMEPPETPAAVIHSQRAEVAVMPVDQEFWARYGGRLTDAQRGEIEQFAKGRAAEAVAISGSMTFQLVTDPMLAAVADRLLEQNPVEGIDFEIDADLRERPLNPESFPHLGFAPYDPMVGEYVWKDSPVRIEPVPIEQMQSLKPIAWVALTFNRKLTVEQVLSQRILQITIQDDQGTVTFIFA